MLVRDSHPKICYSLSLSNNIHVTLSLFGFHAVVLNRIAEEKHEVIWLGDSEIYKIKKELTVHFVKKVGEKLGGKGQLYGALKLSRGYRDPASRLLIECLCDKYGDV